MESEYEAIPIVMKTRITVHTPQGETVFPDVYPGSEVYVDVDSAGNVLVFVVGPTPKGPVVVPIARVDSAIERGNVINHDSDQSN